MLYYVLISVVFLCCLGGCEPANKKIVENGSNGISSSIRLRSKPIAKQPTTIPVNRDSLVVSSAKGRLIRVNASEPKRNQLSKVKAGKPNYTKIDSSALFVSIPGEGETTLPNQYKLPHSGYSIQHGDTIMAAQIHVASWPVPTAAETMRFRDAALHDLQFLDVEQGLPSSYVDAIHEDAAGNMWFGTYGGGVTRYNGNTFTTFTTDQGLPNNIVVSILKDKKGNLWFGTDGSGVSKYDGHTFTNYSTDQGLSGIYLETIVEDNEGSIWFGTNGGGLTKYVSEQDNTFTNYNLKTGLAGNNVLSSILDDNGDLWFGTRDGLSKFDGKGFMNFNDQNGLPNNTVRSLFQDKSGNLWIGTEGGICIYDGKSLVTYTRNQGLPNNRIWHINQDHNGDMWFGTDGGGVCKMSFEGSQELKEVYFTTYTQKEGLSYDFIRAMHVDKKGNIWFGIDGSGVTKFKTNSFTSFTDDKNLSVNSVWSIYEDKKGTLWFGSDVWGIYRYQGGSFISYIDEEGLLEYSVMDMLEDQNGNMWFATFGGGVIKYDGKAFTSFNQQEGFPNRDVYAMLEDRDGNLWFGTQGSGLVKYDGQSFITYSHKDGLANDRIWDILEDRNGAIWIGTFGGGVSKFDGSTFTSYSEEEGLLNSSVNSIFEDHEGNLWLGTDEGVNKLVFSSTNPDSVDNLLYLTTADGLINSITLSLIEDNQNNIWIGTEGGITRLVPIQGANPNAHESYKINTYVQSDGLKGLDVVINSVCLDTQNRMWWGTGKGLTMLNMGHVEPNTEAPELQLNSISVSQQFVDFRNLKDSAYRASLTFGEELSHSFDSIVPFQNYPRSLTLPYHLNHISFSFSAIDWLELHKVRYQYKLDGFEDDWSNLNSNILAEYRNLAYGNYTFNVRAIGTAGIWSDNVTYPFTITRPWWHQWWARALYVIFGLLAITSFDRWRTFRILRKQREVQENIEERNRELEKMVYERTAEIKRQQQLTEEANLALEQKVKERTIELVEKNKKLSDYAFVNAHSLRVPVANIKGIIQLFEAVRSEEEKLELIKMLKGQSDSLDNVLYEIIDMLEKDNYQQEN